MNKSESIIELTKSLVKAQSEFTPVQKTKENKYQNYWYATLDDIVAMVMPVLSTNGLTFTQILSDSEDGNKAIETVLLHESGEYISSKVTIPVLSLKGINDIQAFGAAITYMRRYTLVSMLGITSDEDVDASTPQPQQKQKPKAQPKAQPQTFDPQNVTHSTFGSDWLKLIKYAVEHLPNVTDSEMAKAQIKAQFGDAGRTEKAWEFLRDKYTEDDAGF